MRKAINTEVTKEVPNNNQSDLKEIVESYIYNKDKEAFYKKQASSENTQIKAIMEDLNIDKFDADTGSAIISERTSEDFIEYKLIDFLKKNGVADGIIKTKEYVDFDALESAIYHETIPTEIVREMASCKEVKVTKVLRVKKKGE